MSTRHPTLIDGPAGSLEIAFQQPAATAATALALICHRCPVHGGTMDNKGGADARQGASGVGCATLPSNFRGVGEVRGAFDEGIGTEDAAAGSRMGGAGTGVALAAALIAAGFSFGCFVQSRLPRSPAAATGAGGAGGESFQLAEGRRSRRWSFMAKGRRGAAGCRDGVGATARACGHRVPQHRAFLPWPS